MNPQDAGPKENEIKIVAQIDVGFGNELAIRGAGGGLSWDAGVSMTCIDSDRWTITLQSTTPVSFKFLVNDMTWCFGEDYVAKPGERACITPVF